MNVLLRNLGFANPPQSLNHCSASHSIGTTGEREKVRRKSTLSSAVRKDLDGLEVNTFSAIPRTTIPNARFKIAQRRSMKPLRGPTTRCQAERPRLLLDFRAKRLPKWNP